MFEMYDVCDMSKIFINLQSKYDESSSKFDESSSKMNFYLFDEWLGSGNA